jgi:hypothetical protein
MLMVHRQETEINFESMREKKNESGHSKEKKRSENERQ